MTSKSPEDLLAFARQCQDLAQTYATKAHVALTEYADLVEAGLGIKSSGSVSGNSGKSLIAWAGWLADNGPALRQKVWDGTGVNLTPKGLSQTREWRAVMAMWDDDALPADKVMRIPGNGMAAGRPPMIYFLWPQRFDVYALFGVGPVHDPRPANKSQSNEATEPMLGVIHPPEQQPPTWDDLVAGAKPWPEQSFDFTQEMGEVGYGESQSNEDGEPDG